MNDFLNGIFRIWEKLPDESKTAFVDNLSVKDKSAVKIGKQILEYYVDVSHDLKKREEDLKAQQEELLRQKRNKKKANASSVNQNPFAGHPLEPFLRNLPPEAIQAFLSNFTQNMNPNSNVGKNTHVQSPQNRNQPSKEAEEDIIDMEDDVIEAVWYEKGSPNPQGKKGS